jgi:biotin carboxyl carrier protein
MSADDRARLADVVAPADPVVPSNPVAPAEQDAAARLAAHARIAQLADDLLPALVAKLGETGLGELEVREGGWRIRLRMPPGARPEPVAGSRRPARAGSGAPRVAGGGAATPADRAFAIGPDPDRAGGESLDHGLPGEGLLPGGRPAPRIVATAPAVGFYQPRAGLVPGSGVRAGDRIGVVDVLGVAQEVLAPRDGVLAAALVEPGEPVEYGQEIVVIEQPEPPQPVEPPPGGPAAPAEVTR